MHALGCVAWKSTLCYVNSPDNSPDEASPTGSTSVVFGHNLS